MINWYFLPQCVENNKKNLLQKVIESFNLGTYAIYEAIIDSLIFFRLYLRLSESSWRDVLEKITLNVKWKNFTQNIGASSANTATTDRLHLF